MILNKNLSASLLCLALAVPARAADLRVAASFSLLGEWAREVGGPGVVLTVLVKAGGDAHVYDPLPSDAKALADADLVVAAGAGFEPWLEKLWAASGSRGELVTAADAVPLRQTPDGPDPHWWGDVSLASRFVKALGERFAARDPAGAGEYRRRAAACAARLDALDGWVFEQVRAVPPERRVLASVHDTLGYWAARYGFRVVGAILPPRSAEAADPSPAELLRLGRLLRESGAPAVFTEAASGGALAGALARASGARVAPPLYTDSLGPAGSPAAAYDDMIRYDTRVIVEALRP